MGWRINHFEETAPRFRVSTGSFVQSLTPILLSRHFNARCESEVRTVTCSQQAPWQKPTSRRPFGTVVHSKSRITVGNYKQRSKQWGNQAWRPDGSESLNAAVTKIKDIDRLRSHTTNVVRFKNIPVSTGGVFSAGAKGNRIEGSFNRPSHAEPAGTFEQVGIMAL